MLVEVTLGQLELLGFSFKGWVLFCLLEDKQKLKFGGVDK